MYSTSVLHVLQAADWVIRGLQQQYLHLIIYLDCHGLLPHSPINMHKCFEPFLWSKPRTNPLSQYNPRRPRIQNKAVFSHPFHTFHSSCRMNHWYERFIRTNIDINVVLTKSGSTTINIVVTSHYKSSLKSFFIVFSCILLCSMLIIPTRFIVFSWALAQVPTALSALMLHV